MSEIENRETFHAVHRYLWEERKGIGHLIVDLDRLDGSPGVDQTFPVAGRVHNFYRGGFGVGMHEVLKRNGQSHYHDG